MEYLQDPIAKEAIYSLQGISEHTIKPNDELYINVSSFDDVSFNYFGETGDSKQGYGSELTLSLISYTVDKSGNIFFPILGNIYLQGLTLEEARAKLTTQLSDYFNQPTINIKFAFKKITIVGEVKNPGNHTYSKDDLNIFEALSLAGDMTPHGNRSEVYILRRDSTQVIKTLVDLTNDEVVFSSNYFVQADDVIYVKPRKSLKWDIVSTPISLFISTITASILILNYFDVGN